MAGRHGYEKSSIDQEGFWNNTFSIGTFKYVMTNDGKRVKKSKAIVRVVGKPSDSKKVYEKCDEIVSLLDNLRYDGPKTVKVS